MISFLKKRWYLVLIVLLVIGFIGYRSFGPRDSSKVKTYLVKKTDLKELLSFSGGIDAEEKAIMTFQTTGKLNFVRVKEGDMVKKGAWLAGLDMGDFDQAVTSTWYKYIAADANAKQVEDSVKNNDSTESFTQKNLRVAAQTARDIAYDNWLQARRNQANAILKSPINGVVYNVTTAQPGSFITLSNQFEVDIINPATVIFSASADQTDVVKLSPGMVANITLDAFPNKQIPAIIKEIAYIPTAGETGTVYEVKFSMDQTNDGIRMGMTGDVSFLIREIKGVLAVPQNYVKTIKGSKVVYKNVNGRSQITKVSVGETLEGQTEIQSGLSEGEMIYDQAL